MVFMISLISQSGAASLPRRWRVHGHMPVVIRARKGKKSMNNDRILGGGDVWSPEAAVHSRMG